MTRDRYVPGVKRVCIIGGGPAGVAAAKHLIAENCFEAIDIYDQRTDVGGVWSYEPKHDDLTPCPVPHTDPEAPLERPRWLGEPPRATYQSPMYARLEANLPKMLMQHSDLDFPEDTQLFPKRTETLAYLERYAHDVKHLIKPDCQVTLAEKANKAQSGWSVSTKNLREGKQTTQQYDAVIAACGHYTVPYVPDYPGIEAFSRHHPGIITHSKWFDDPRNYEGRRVLVIGSGPSGSDIAAQIAEYCTKPLLVSTRSPSTNLPAGAMSLPAISEFDPSNRAVRFADGQVVRRLDSILFCTGYLYSFPFFSSDMRKTLIYPPSDALGKFYVGERCRNVYQHLFYTPDPTLALLTLPWNIIPFPVAEGQGALVARVWSGRLSVPSEAAMQEWESDAETKKGTGKSFHRLAPPSDVDYINYLWRWAENADSLSSGKDIGKTAPYWGPWQRWMRIHVPEFKKTFVGKGEQRHGIRTLEELGFPYPGDREQRL